MKISSFLWNKGLAGAALLLLALPYPATARNPHRHSAASPALIVNSGDAATPGYRISVSASGHAESAFRPLAQRRGTALRKHVLLPSTLRRRFFSDLAQAAPVSRLPVSTEAPGDAPDVQMIVRYQGSQSPDLRRAESERGRRLYRDVQQIAQMLRLPIPNTP